MLTLYLECLIVDHISFDWQSQFCFGTRCEILWETISLWWSRRHLLEFRSGDNCFQFPFSIGWWNDVVPHSCTLSTLLKGRMEIFCVAGTQSMDSCFIEGGSESFPDFYSISRWFLSQRNSLADQQVQSSPGNNWEILPAGYKLAATFSHHYWSIDCWQLKVSFPPEHRHFWSHHCL